MEEKKLDLNSIIGFVLISGILIWMLYSNAPTPEELKEKGEAQARDFELVTVLFTDFKGFTQASEKMTANELVDELNYCFKGFDRIMEKYGIEKIKTIGDAYMAVAGLHGPAADAAVNALVVGLAPAGQHLQPVALAVGHAVEDVVALVGDVSL